MCNNCKNCRPILCKKVLDRIYSVHKQEDIPENLRLENLKKSKLIEKYPFITSGFETFNQSETFNYFCIKECENYEAIKQHTFKKILANVGIFFVLKKTNSEYI